MKRLEKRYIYSSILSGFAFAIFYALVDLEIFVSILLTIGVYIGGVFLFKSKDIRMLDKSAIARYNFEMSKLNNYKDKIKDKIIKEKITKIVNECQKICDYLLTNPSNVSKIYNFLDYYLPFTDKIVTKYIEASNKKEKTFVENKLILKMTVYIREVEQECNKLLENIIKSKDKSFDFELKLFEKTSDFEDDEGSEK